MSEIKVPSQVGEWTITRDPARGTMWIATHSELERATDEGGPVSAMGPTLAAMLLELVAIEAEGDFGGFQDVIEARTGCRLDSEQLAEALLLQVDSRFNQDDVETLTDAIGHLWSDFHAAHHAAVLDARDADYESDCDSQASRRDEDR